MFGKWASAAVDVIADEVQEAQDAPPSSPKASATGWALQDVGPAGDDITDEYRALVDRPSLPNNAASDYEYVFVPGLLTEHYGDAYMSRNLERMEKLGLTARKAPVDTDNSVAFNAAIVRSTILECSKRVIVFGHSKGGIDAAAAISEHPDVQAKVSCLLCVQSPFGGTHVSDIISGSGVLMAAAKQVVENLFKGDVNAIVDLSYEARKRYLAEHPYPLGGVPVISFVSTCEGGPMGAVISYLKTTYGVESDGLVPSEDAIVPGSKVVRVHGVDHGSSVGLMSTISHGMQMLSEQSKDTNHDAPDDLTEALVTLAIRHGK